MSIAHSNPYGYRNHRYCHGIHCCCRFYSSLKEGGEALFSSFFIVVLYVQTSKTCFVECGSVDAVETQEKMDIVLNVYSILYWRV